MASEVRNLALRSAQAAKEIKARIAHSVEIVDGGAMLAQQAGSAMDQVVASFHQVNALVTEIAGPKLGERQVTQAVAQMDEVTQQNAALVEQAAAAESLEDQARSLAQTVAIFKIDERVAPAVEMPQRLKASARALLPRVRRTFVTPRRGGATPAVAQASDELAEF